MVLDIETELNIYNLELHAMDTETRIHLEFEGIYLTRIVLEHEDYEKRIKYKHDIYTCIRCDSNWSVCRILVRREYANGDVEVKIEKQHYFNKADKVANTLLDLIQNIIDNINRGGG